MTIKTKTNRIPHEALTHAFHKLAERLGLPLATEDGPGYELSIADGGHVKIQRVESDGETVREPFRRIGPMKRKDFVQCAAFAEVALELMLREAQFVERAEAEAVDEEETEPVNEPATAGARS